MLRFRRGIGFHNLIFRLKALFFTTANCLSGFLSPEKESLRKKESQRGQGCGSRKKDKLFSCSAIPFPLWESPTPLLLRYRLLRDTYCETSATFSSPNKRTIPKRIPFGMVLCFIEIINPLVGDLSPFLGDIPGIGKCAPRLCHAARGG